MKMYIMYFSFTSFRYQASITYIHILYVYYVNSYCHEFHMLHIKLKFYSSVSDSDDESESSLSMFCFSDRGETTDKKLQINGASCTFTMQ